MTSTSKKSEVKKVHKILADEEQTNLAKLIKKFSKNLKIERSFNLPGKYGGKIKNELIFHFSKSYKVKERYFECCNFWSLRFEPIDDSDND